MQRYVLKRVAQGIIVLFVVTIIIFVLGQLSGAPVDLMTRHFSTPEVSEQLRERWGLDESLPVQYWRFISGIARGDFGESVRYGQPALEVWLTYLPNTLILATAAMSIVLIISIPTGILSAIRVGGWFDKFAKIFAIMGQSMPEYWLGLMLILAFSIHLGWLPTSGMGTFQQLLMPAFTLSYYFIASLTRLTRSTMLDVLDSDYIKMARIKGVPENLVIVKHAFKNALVSILSLLGVMIISLPTTSVITEVVFRWPGIGRLLVNAALERDFPLVRTCFLLISVGYIVASIVADILYAYVDPRIRYK